MNILLGLVAAMMLAAPALGQDGRSLEGTTVTLKMDMPATSDGVDVYPGSGADFRKIGAAVKAYGVGVHAGESIMITKVVVKDHHIEVQLGGGGYGTFGDILAQSAATPPAVPYQDKTRREKDLELDAKYSSDYWERRQARDELHDVRNDRYRDNAVASAINAQNQAAAQANVRAQRAQSGSRFNIRYQGGYPPGATSAQGIMDALSQYVDFGDVRAPSSPAPSRAADGAAPALRKGLTVVQVEKILGPAAKVSQKTEGSMEIGVREYVTDDGQLVTAQFVGGVLVDYRISPR